VYHFAPVFSSYTWSMQFMNQKTHLSIQIIFFLVLFFLFTLGFVQESHAEFTIEKIVVSGTINGEEKTNVTVWESNWLTTSVRVDTGTGADVDIVIYRSDGSGSSDYRVTRTGYDSGWISSAGYYNFFGNVGLGTNYTAYLDNTSIGTFRVYEGPREYADLVVSDFYPDYSGPYTVGDTVLWRAFVKNEGGAFCDEPRLGYYLGTKYDDYSNLWATDEVEDLDPGETSSSETASYTFQSSDIGTRYMIALADYGGTCLETNESNNAYSIQITVNPPNVTVPNMIGMEELAAESSISSASLSLGNKIYTSSSTVPSGKVISQIPDGGTSVFQGSFVFLVISSGNPTVRVPNVTGSLESAAEIAITSQNLIVGNRIIESNNTIPAGNIISQNPISGTIVGYGASVDLVVSSGPSIVQPTLTFSPIVSKVSRGGLFIVELQINNIDDLYGHEIDINFDPEKIEVIEVSQGDFLSQNGSDATFWQPPVIDNAAGKISDIVCLRLTPEIGVTGSGNLAKIVFKELVNGAEDYATYISFDTSETKFSDPLANPIAIGKFSHSIVDVTHEFICLPDPGQIQCFNDVGPITCPLPGQPFYGQDANYHHSCPTYVKLDKYGRDLPDNAENWVMVRDNIQGLVWEVKQASDGVQDYQNLHDADNIYTYANCDEGFILPLNENNFGGRINWRLPTIDELQLFGLEKFIRNGFNVDQYSCSEDTSLLNYILSQYCTFSSELSGPLAYNFESCSPRYVSNDTSVYVIAVSPLIPEDRYIDNRDGTVTDLYLGLMWQQNPVSISNWKDSLSYCENLELANYSDWHLPDIFELCSLMDQSRRRFRL